MHLIICLSFTHAFSAAISPGTQLAYIPLPAHQSAGYDSRPSMLPCQYSCTRTTDCLVAGIHHICFSCCSRPWLSSRYRSGTHGMSLPNSRLSSPKTDAMDVPTYHNPVL